MSKIRWTHFFVLQHFVFRVKTYTIASFVCWMLSYDFIQSYVVAGNFTTNSDHLEAWFCIMLMTLGLVLIYIALIIKNPHFIGNI